MRVMRSCRSREGASPRKHRLAAAAGGLVLAGGLLSVGPTAALAASSDRIDVGWTILQNGYWKGSGSFSNLNGTYTSVCVGLWVKDAVLGLQEKSVRCVNTPKGSGFAFSAPDVACYTFSWGTVFTTVTGRSGTRVVDEKWSNSINESC